MDFGLLFYIINAAIPLTLIISALLMLVLAIPSAPELNSYRTSRKVMAYAYLVFGILSGINALINETDTSDTEMFKVAVISMMIASSQAFLFTYSLITLINPAFFTKRWIIRQIVPISTFILLSLLFLLLHETGISIVIFYGFLAFYLYQLSYYTFLFTREFKQYSIDAGNYFSEDAEKHLNWVKLAFFSALGIGIVVLLLILYTDPILDLIVAILCGGFYIFFLIKYINYPYIFNRVIIHKEEDKPKAAVAIPIVETEEHSNLPRLIEKWIDDKAYTESDITIVNLSSVFGTNRTYLSSYINTSKNKTFKEWISDLRIEEAQRLLITEPNTPINEIAYRVGFSDKGNFSNRFTKNTGLSPSRWRQKHIL